MIDYAYPCMMAEKALKDLHDAMLMKNYKQALQFAMVASEQIKQAEYAIALDYEKAQKSK